MVHFLYKTNVVLLVGFCEISMSCFDDCHNSTTMVLSITMRIHQDFVDIQNPILPRLLMKLSENIWNYPMISGGFLKTSENILMIIWKQMKLSEIIWWFPALSEIATSRTWVECVFFAEKNDTTQRLARGLGGLAPPSAMTKINFCWCYSPTKLKWVMADIRIKIRKSEESEVGEFTNWNW